MITDSPEQLSISEKKIVSVSTEMENSSITPEQIDLHTGDVSASDVSDDTSNSDDIPTKKFSPLSIISLLTSSLCFISTKSRVSAVSSSIIFCDKEVVDGSVLWTWDELCSIPAIGRE